MSRTRDIGIAVGRLVIAYNLKEQDMRLERIATYEKGWQDIPQPLLELAVDRWIQTSQWFPKVAEIRQMAENIRRELMAAHPYTGCEVCDGSSWAIVKAEDGLPRAKRCACFMAHNDKLHRLGVTSQPLALPAGKPEEAA